MRLVFALALGGALGLAVPLPAAAAPDLSVKVSNALYEFGYSYPAAAGAIPGVKAILDHDLAKTRASLVKESTDDRSEAKQHDYPYRMHSYQTDWKVVTDLPGWLSLSALTYTFSGGAHGNTAFDTLLWDKAARVRRRPIDVFTSVAAFEGAVRARFCAALDRERLKRRGTAWAKDDMFSQCIDPAKDATVIFGSANGSRFTRIGFLIGPYAAGPYAEGTYEITLPVTPAILRAVKPRFRGAFAPG